MSEQLNLAQRIAKAAASVGGKLSADKKNKEQNYEYISSDKMLAVIGQAMAENGVVVFPAVVEHEMQIGQTGSGKSRYDVRVRFDMTVSDGDTNFVMPWFGVGNDYSAPDKATYKAITSGHKYFLAKLFCIGVGNEDGEHEAEDVTRAQAQPKVQAPKPVVLSSVAATHPVDWKTPADAQKWAIDSGHCNNEFEAKNSFKNSLKEVTGQDKSLDSNHLAAVLDNFYAKHIGRKSEPQQELKQAA